MVANKQIYILLEEPEDFRRYGLEEDTAAILPAGQKAGGLGFANYVSRRDWKYAVRNDESWKEFFKRVVFPRLKPKVPIERVYAEYGVGIEGHGFETPFIIAASGDPEIARKKVNRFLHDITDLFPQRKAEGLTFKVAKFVLPASKGSQLDLFDTPSENIVYGVIQTPSYSTVT